MGRIATIFGALSIALTFLPVGARGAAAQTVSAAATAGKPEEALIGALEAACHQDSKEFAPYLLASSAKSFEGLPPARQITVLKRISMTTVPGKARALLDDAGRTVVQCNTPAETVTLRLEPAEVDHNVAFIPVAVSGGETTRFGMVRQPSGWRLYSLGILVLDIPDLIQEWQVAEMQANEQETMNDLFVLYEAIKTYHDGFEQWPDQLGQLGPAPPNEVSPDHAQLVSAALASGTADGYRFRYTLVTGSKGQIQGFVLGAVPEKYGETGHRSFYLDAEGKLHGADHQGAPATAQDPVLNPPTSSSPSS